MAIYTRKMMPNSLNFIQKKVADIFMNQLVHIMHDEEKDEIRYDCFGSFRGEIGLYRLELKFIPRGELTGGDGC